MKKLSVTLLNSKVASSKWGSLISSCTEHPQEAILSVELFSLNLQLFWHIVLFPLLVYIIFFLSNKIMSVLLIVV